MSTHGPTGITIGFSTTNKWMSGVIRWITRSPVSHAWIGFEDATLGISLVLQAEAWGVELRPRSRWEKENKAKAVFSSPDSGDRLKVLISETLGARYDWRSAGLLGIIGWAKRWVKSRFTLRLSRSPKRLMCAELVTRYLHALGLAKDLDEETSSPLDLLAWSNHHLTAHWRHEDVLKVR